MNFYDIYWEEYIPWLVARSNKPQMPHYPTLETIKAQIDKSGLYEGEYEFRIMTTCKISIRKIDSGFEVKIKSEPNIDFISPTLERAYQCLTLYIDLTLDAFNAIGWPSWKAKGFI